MSARSEGVQMHEALYFYESIILRCKKKGHVGPHVNQAAFDATMYWMTARLKQRICKQYSTEMLNTLIFNTETQEPQGTNS